MISLISFFVESCCVSYCLSNGATVIHYLGTGEFLLYSRPTYLVEHEDGSGKEVLPVTLGYPNTLFCKGEGQ